MSKPLAPNSSVTVGNVVFDNNAALSLIAGPCQFESRQHAFDMAGALKELTGKLGIGLVYKSSYDKANRTSLSATRGAGMDAHFRSSTTAQGIFASHSDRCPHRGDSARSSRRMSMSCRSGPSCRARPTCLSPPRDRQGDQRKEGQFLAPWDMKNVVAKITGSGNLTCSPERGALRLQYAGTRCRDGRSVPVI